MDLQYVPGVQWNGKKRPVAVKYKSVGGEVGDVRRRLRGSSGQG